jgi:hypothetical protein
MLELFTLKTIKDIFEDRYKVSSMAILIYINCLMKEFDNKPMLIEHGTSFIIFKNKFNYKKFEKHFKELELAEVLSCNGDKDFITFHNVWSKYIDVHRLKSNEEDLLPNLVKVDKTIIEQLSNDIGVIQACNIKHSLNTNAIKELSINFVFEQIAINKTYRNWGDLVKHFLSWVQYHKDKFVKEENKNIKSKSKILGM